MLLKPDNHARAARGKAELKTVSGDTSWIVWEGDKLWLRDEA